MVVFRSFDTLGVSVRGGIEIRKTNVGWEVEEFSAYTDDELFIYHVEFTDKYPDYTDNWNERIFMFGKLWELFHYEIRVGIITPYKVVKK